MSRICVDPKPFSYRVANWNALIQSALPLVADTKGRALITGKLPIMFLSGYSVCQCRFFLC